MPVVPDVPTISRALQLLNSGDAEAAADLLRNVHAQPNATIDLLLNYPSNRLAVYGSLAPGERNHHILTPITGSWLPGSVRGFLNDAGWGTALGYRSLVWDPTAPEVSVLVFESVELSNHWLRIDEFEGPDYRRIWLPVITSRGILVANLYAANL